MFAKKLEENKYITYLSVPEIDFEVSTENWHLDGEYKKIPSPIHMEILPKSLRILI